MKLSEIKGEQALEVLADLMEPVAEICSDEEITNLLNEDVQVLKIAQKMLKNHKKAVITILAVLDGKDPENYEVNILTLPVKLFEVLNDKRLQQLFKSAE